MREGINLVYLKPRVKVIFLFRSTLVSCSSDKTVACWDYETGMRIKRLKGHSSFVNSCCPARRGPELIVSGSDDGTVKVCTSYTF